jgi:hypothetical protein
MFDDVVCVDAGSAAPRPSSPTSGHQPDHAALTRQRSD